MENLAASYRYCRTVARRRARNFYYGFLLLPRAQRDAICAVYAFMRYCDDLSDEPGPEGASESTVRAAAIRRWRASLAASLAGSFDGHPAWPAFCDTVRRFRIPHDYFFQMIEGVSSDLEPRRFSGSEDLYRYCYQVASVAGLAAIHIFGFDSQEAPRLAEKCGIAFQLTNILRDLREDAARGRLYLPLEDMARFGVAPEAIERGEASAGFLELLRFEAERTRRFYQEAQPLIGMVQPGSRAALAALIGIYSRLLERVEAAGSEVLARRIALPAAEKCWIALKARLTRW